MLTWNEPAILLEDKDLMVVVKPAGVVTNKTETVHEQTIQSWWMDWLRQKRVEWPAKWQEMVPADDPTQYGTPEEIFGARGGIVHRLDKETSGILLLAKHPGSLAHLLKQFRQRQISKKYVCLVHGKFQVLAGTLELPLARDPRHRTRFTVDATGRKAETGYLVDQQFRGLKPEVVAELAKTVDVRFYPKKISQGYQGFSLVSCTPLTGRTHQLRVHLDHVRHPIVSDPTYLGRKRLALDTTWCPRLFLHAAKLSFTHPRTGKLIELTAGLPTDLQAVLARLEVEELSG